MGFLPAAILCQEPWKSWQGFAGEPDNANPTAMLLNSISLYPLLWYIFFAGNAAFSTLLDYCVELACSAKSRISVPYPIPS